MHFFCRITSIYQQTNAHIISHKTLLKHFKTLRHVSILSDHHQGALFLAKFMLQYSQFNLYLQTRCCGSISCCVGMCCGAVAQCASEHTKHTVKLKWYEMKFLAPNYSCLQNPWLCGYRPQIPVPSVLCPSNEFVEPPPPIEQTSWIRHWLLTIFIALKAN